LIATLMNLVTLVRFAFDSSSAPGTVVGLTPQIHDRFQVEYVVDAKRVNMESNDSGGASAHRIGDDVTVYYLRAEPTFASLVPPGRALSNAVFYMALLAGLAATWFTIFFEGWRARARSSPGRGP